MLYYTEVDGNQVKLEIYDTTDGLTVVKMPDGREYKVDFEAALGHDLYSLLIENQSHEVHIETNGEPSTYEVSLDGQAYKVKVESERQHRIANLRPKAAVQTGEIQIKAPMPGLVTIVAVEVGQAVEQGQRVAVLEAMKMENELRAVRAGVVKTINVQPGQTVEQNKVLVVLE